MGDNLLFQAFVYLSASVLAVPLAKKLGLGSVLGYLIAGVIVGPFVLNFIGEEGAYIMHFAEFGVVMMMFLIGLELKPSLLWKLRTSVIGLGGLQSGLTTLVFTAIVLVLTDYAWQTAVAIGLTLSLSSTALILQTLEERGLMKSIPGRASFSVLLFQDITFIPVLAIFPLLAVYETDSTSLSLQSNLIKDFPVALRALIITGSIAFIILLGRYLMTYIFRFIAKTGIKELFTATSLLLIISITLLMSFVGLSPALGTFLAGVVLAQSEYRHVLETNILPFKGLLLGLFFIAVGASIDFTLIAQEPLHIFTLVAGLMSIKFVLLMGIGKLFKLKIDSNLIFSILLSQGGTFAFVLFSFGISLGVFTLEISSPLIAAVAISMTVTPLLLIINERLILPFIGVKGKKEEQETEEGRKEDNAVLIAGFSHYGSTIGQFMRANNYQATYLDINPDLVKEMRTMGLNVYFGDASRYDLLETAGAANAKLLIVAVDKEEKAIRIIKTAKKHFPHLKIYARSQSWNSFKKMTEFGADKIYCEHFEAAIRIGEDSLKTLGEPNQEVHLSATRFMEEESSELQELLKKNIDKHQLVFSSSSFIKELEHIIKEDKAVSTKINEIENKACSIRKIIDPIVQNLNKEKIK